MKIEEDHPFKFVRMNVSGITDDLKPCPNPLCRNEQPELIRQENEEENDAVLQILCSQCGTSSPKSKFIAINPMDEEEVVGCAYAVTKAWNDLERYNVGVKYADNDTLQSCPFCKSDRIEYKSHTYMNKGFGHVMCLGCGLTSAAFLHENKHDMDAATRTRQQAVFAWNMLTVTDKDNVIYKHDA